MKHGTIKAMHKAGFSLVELAIVLAIIGLIVGGIMVGQDVMHNSKLQSIQTDIMKYDSAFQQFHQKYNSYPGDMPDATTYFTSVGNGNGNFNFDTLAESVYLWEHLAKGGFIDGSYTGTLTNPVVMEQNVPSTAFRGVGVQIRNYSATPAVTGEQSGGAVIEIGGISTYYANQSFLTSADAKSVDKKMDDGSATSGRLRAAGSGACPAWNATSGDYTLSNANIGCMFIWQLDRAN